MNSKAIPKTKRPEYLLLKKLRYFCNNPNSTDYKWYGEKGITVCKDWDNLDQFIEDVGERPSPNHVLKRIDSNKGFYKENCKWELKSELNTNNPNNHSITYNGRTMNATGWANLIGVKPDTFRKRLKSMTPEQAIEMNNPFN